jgi:uncharacterized repeat protein (TIGR01451 family)
VGEGVSHAVGKRRRAATYGAVVGLAVVFLTVPGVLAQSGPQPVDTVTICHRLAGGAYEPRTARETDFYRVPRPRHGRHRRDIVPPFTIERPRSGELGSFPGRNWSRQRQAIFNAGCLRAPPTQVRICHATNSSSNPYTVQEPAIANNGDLNGGHLKHKGPVYPAPDWGDIIPPYTYVDENGVTQTFPGYNWSEDGQAIWQHGCEPPVPPTPERLTPILECVEVTEDRFLAHFGYDNPNTTTVEPPSSQNRFVPAPPNRGQPIAFTAGRVKDAFQVDWDGDPLAWFLTGNTLTVSRSSPRCQGSITIVKRLVPADDPGRFDLEIDGEVAGGAAAVGDGDTTGTIAVSADRHTVGESAAPGTSLGDYAIEIVCRADGGAGPVVAGANGPSVAVQVRRNDAIVCAITNTAGQQAQDVRPVLECVVFNASLPDLAVWGYVNRSGGPVSIPVGPDNGFSPDPVDRGQPVVFEPGTLVGVFQTPFQAGRTTLRWTLSGETATASASSPRCTATVELRKVVVPPTDPGVFELRINGRLLASGGNGTTTGPVVVGVGEGTASETAASGTNLADYESSVQCTRNGGVAVTVAGTKIDGAVARGDVVVCTFTNRRIAGPQPPEPPEPPEPPQPPQLLDLAVVKTARPTTVVVGGRITWTMTVTNRSSVAAADVNGVKVNDPRSFRTRLISLRASQGTCRPFTCNLGRLAPGASATVVAVTQALQVGPVVDIVRIGSEEPESNYRNNVAAALARVIGPFRPPVGLDVCRTLTAAPDVLEAGRASVVRLRARNRRGDPIPQLAVRASGPGGTVVSRTDRRGVVRFTLLPTEVGLVRFSTTTVRLGCLTQLGVVRGAQTQVTG